PFGGSRRARLRRGRPAARGDRGARLGRAWRGRRLRGRSARVTRDLLDGRTAVREALRGRRAVLEVWAGERAAATFDWLEGGAPPRPKRVREITAHSR